MGNLRLPEVCRHQLSDPDVKLETESAKKEVAEPPASDVLDNLPCIRSNVLEHADKGDIGTEPLSSGADIAFARFFWVHMDTLYLPTLPRLWCCFEHLEEENLYGSDDEDDLSTYNLSIVHSVSGPERALCEACAGRSASSS